MDQQIWTDVIPNPSEIQNMPDSSAYTSDSNESYIDLPSEDSADLNIWNSGGSSSSRHSVDQGSHDDTKMEHGWSSSLTINGNLESVAEERHLEASNLLLGSRVGGGLVEATRMRPVGNMNLNLNCSEEDVDQSFSQNPSFPINSDQNAIDVGRSGRVLEATQLSVAFMPGFSGSVPSSGSLSNIPGSSSRGAGFLSEWVEGASGNLFDAHRLSRKRKNIEGVSAQCSVNGSSICLHQGDNSLPRLSANTTLSMSSSSNYPSGANPSGEPTNPRIEATLNVGDSESSLRNCRIRMNHPQHVASLSDQRPAGNNLWPAHQSSNAFIPFNPPLESNVAVDVGISESESPVFPVPTLVPNMNLFPVNVASSSRSGTSSRSLAISGQRSAASREEANSRSMSRNNVLENSIPAPRPDVRHLMQHPSSWSMVPTSQAGSSSRVVQPLGWIPHQIPPSQHQRRLPVVDRQSLIPSGSGQSINPAQLSSHSNNLQELQRAALLRNIQQMRSAAAMPARFLALRESRSRMLSEQGEIAFNQFVNRGAVGLHDRHRDMRLDVDNMSYEELLALTERIGTVSTGLSEETILMRLKQRKYISLTDEPPSEVEPCCICQEDYVEEEYVGRLDCGHDFHTDCIKKWLTLKNLCPICRTTGLATSKDR